MSDITITTTNGDTVIVTDLLPSNAAAVSAGIAITQAGIATAAAIGTAADRVQTGLDAATATTQAGIATTQAAAAAVAAVAAAADRVQTGLDAATATTQAGNATASASDAAVQAGVATTQATAAAASATAAASSATTASGSATTAASSATAASGSATTAASSATAASGSATAAASSATTASGSATAAASSATTASGSATAAASSATAADASADAALVSETNAAASAAEAAANAFTGALGANTFTHTRGTLTTDLGVSRRTVTLNNAAVAFTVDKVNVTDTASAAGSLFADYQISGVSKFKVRKDGAVYSAADTFSGMNGYLELVSTQYDIFLSPSNGIRTVNIRAGSTYGLAVCADYPLGFSAGPTFATDVALRRDAADALALRRGTNAQTFNLYNTYTGGSSYERGFMRWASNVLEIGAEAAGSGTARTLALKAMGATYSINSSGIFSGPYLNATNRIDTVLIYPSTDGGTLTISGGSASWDNTGRLNVAGGGGSYYSHAGGNVYVYGGTGGYSDGAGGNVYLDGGAPAGASAAGNIIVGATRGHLVPGADNVVNFGSASEGWKEIWCDNGTINTSDARRKTPVSILTAAEIAAAKALAQEIGSFKFLASVEAKGDSARLHIGMTVQRACEVMSAHGLVPTAYSFICHDAWPDEFKQVQTNPGEKVTKQREVTRQAFITVPVEKESVEVIDGKPVLVRKVEEEKQLLADPVPVLTEDGMPVMQETEDGELVPLTYPMPRMETVTEDYEDEADPVYESVLVRAAGDKYSFRVHELLLFIVAGMSASAQL